MSKKMDLLLTAANIIQNEGIQKLTMDYLAQKSDMTKGGVLYHFKSKGNLLIKMNEMVIDEFEEKIKMYQADMAGSYQFTRAYAMATLYYLNEESQSLLPAVLVASHEDGESQRLWERFADHWNESFINDGGDQDKVLRLRLMADGVWFYLLYYKDEYYKKRIEKLLLMECQILSKEKC